MRVFASLLVAAGLAVAFFLGRLSQPSRAAAAADRSGSVFVAARGDVIRIPGIATRCLVATEGGKPDVVCGHVRRAPYQLILFSDELLVYKNGNPDEPRFSVRWKP